MLTCLDLAQYAAPGPLRALDIGTGHVAVYALLLHKLRPEAYVVGSELEPTSLAHAREQAARNSIAPAAVEIKGVPPDNSLLGHLKDQDSWSFTMCNPPFFASLAEAEEARLAKATPASAAPTCAPNEQVTRGGEELFVGQMIDESVAYGDKVGWFTSLVGRYASLGPLVKHVLTKTTNYAVISLRQGNTARWVLAWSFSPYRLPDVSCTDPVKVADEQNLTRPAHVEKGTSFAKMVSLSNSFVHDEEEKDLDEVRQAITDVLKSVNIDTTADEEGVIHLAPTTNTWSRQARRAAQRAAQYAEGGEEASAALPESSTSQEPLFRARLSFTKPEAPASTDADRESDVEAPSPSVPKARAAMEWQWGRDRTIVDAFWKFVIQKAGLRKRKQSGEDGPAEKKSRPGAADDEEQQTNNPYLQHQDNPYLSHGQGGANRGRGRGRGGRRGALGGGRGRGGYSRPQDQGWARRQ